MNTANSSTIVPEDGTPQAFGWLDRWPAVLAVCLVAIMPLLLVDFPPLVDLYGHLGRFAVQTELAQRPELQPFYSYEWKLIGNLGGDILVQALHPLLGLEVSVRCVVILTQLLGALGLMLVSREIHGRVTPFAVAAIPLLYGYPFNYGFINYTLSMALALLAFAAWLRLHRNGREVAAGLWLAVAGAAIWVCHTYGWAFLGLLTGSAMLAETIAARTHPVRAVGRILAACWPLLLPVVPMAVWRAESAGPLMSGWSLPFKFNWLFSPFRSVWKPMDIGALAVVAGLLYWVRLSRSAGFDLRVGIAALLCVAFFFILPSWVFGSAFADMRLLPYGLAVGLVAIGTARVGPRELKIAGLVALAFFGVRMAVTSAGYVQQDRMVQAALPALDKMPKGARVAFFVIKPCAVRWTLPVLDHVAGAALARRNAFVNDQWQQPGVNPMIVHYPAGEPFVQDPSHLVQSDACGASILPKVTPTLARLPQSAFTHVWIVGYVPERYTVPKGFVEMPGSGSGKLFRIEPQG